MNAKKLLALGFIGACMATGVQAHSYEEDAFSRALRAELAGEEHVVVQKTDGPSFTVQGANDVKLTVGGEVKSEYRRAHNMKYYNKDLKEQYGVWIGTGEVDFKLAYGEKTYGKPAVTIAAKPYIKYYGGDFSRTIRTQPGTVTIADATVAAPASTVNMPLPWLKHLSAEIDLGILSGRKMATDHTFKIGMFGFKLGRGIAYGPFYGLSKDFLGVFSTPSSFSPFGALLHGDIIKDKLSYDLYFARLEEKSGSVKQVLANGVGKTADVFAARIAFKVDSAKMGNWESESYALFNEASDQNAEQANDSKSQLFTGGWAFDYNKGNWELGGEIAFNRGGQELKAIDRNKVVILRDSDTDKDSPNLIQHYTHVYTDDQGDDYDNMQAPLTIATIDAVEAYTGRENGVDINVNPPEDTLNGEKYVLRNADDRFRPASSNDYRGWMMTLDGSYAIPAHNMKLSAAVGHASGGTDPRLLADGKAYNGFIGLNENYSGKRVQSVVVLGHRTGFSPLSFNGDATDVVNDPSLSDLTYVGGGVAYELPRKNIKVSLNILGFWTDIASAKVANVNELAAKFKGTEANLNLEWEAMHNLSINGQFALFKPGQHFTDIKGTDVEGNLTGDDTGFFGAVGMKYTF